MCPLHGAVGTCSLWHVAARRGCYVVGGGGRTPAAFPSFSGGWSGGGGGVRSGGEEERREADPGLLHWAGLQGLSAGPRLRLMQAPPPGICTAGGPRRAMESSRYPNVFVTRRRLPPSPALCPPPRHLGDQTTRPQPTTLPNRVFFLPALLFPATTIIAASRFPRERRNLHYSPGTYLPCPACWLCHFPSLLCPLPPDLPRRHTPQRAISDPVASRLVLKLRSNTSRHPTIHRS